MLHEVMLGQVVWIVLNFWPNQFIRSIIKYRRRTKRLPVPLIFGTFSHRKPPRPMTCVFIRFVFGRFPLRWWIFAVFGVIPLVQFSIPDKTASSIHLLGRYSLTGLHPFRSVHQFVIDLAGAFIVALEQRWYFLH